MIYVCPIPRPLRGRLGPCALLTAFPTPAEPAGEAGLVLCDSGAYGLSRRGIDLGERHFPALEWYYLRHGASDRPPLIGVAPDVFLRPWKTLRNWESWVGGGRRPVAPVVQFSRNKRLDWNLLDQSRHPPHGALRAQVEAYAARDPGCVLLSNPGLRGADAVLQGMAGVVDYVRWATGCTWVHVLGAGWDLRDVRDWSCIPGIDSIDSIAYYEEARRGVPWWTPRETWEDTAVANGLAANFAALGARLP